jgi:DNA modification methylase
MQIQTNSAVLVNGDCVEEIEKVESESIHFTVFSPPFPEMYVYNNDIRDMSNCTDFDVFKEHFRFLSPELFRITKQGRNVAVHCMDLPVQKGKHGYIGLRDFSGMIREAMEDAGFIYHSRVTIWKNPVTEMQRTKALGLLHKQIKKDATMSRVGIPDYILIFRKDGDREDPVHCPISVDTWQQYASPVWMDIDYGDTLNAAIAREDKDEKHICPLQLPTIQRLIALYTNECDTVFTPFMGIGSEIFQAIKMKRKGYGIELKKSYFDIAIKNVKAVEESNKQQLLFA